ncbi:MAG TPA: ABC transporter substrate-binding protein [Usitatibacter sp.]|nr:ABC transporter substrate-binding protein [Usitatibacter sp.]
MRSLLVPLFALALVSAAPATAKTFRWAAVADHSSADPHGQNQIVNNAINGQVYEALVMRGKKTEIVPRLAESWTQTAPTVWRFKLRRGVRFHDGTAFGAEDVVFSIKRAQGDTSTFRVYGRAVGEPRKVDEHTVEFTTPVPNPVMLETVALLGIMSKAWSEKHGVARAQDFAKKEETHASRNANGTGPFMLVSREADVRSLFRRNPHWWGKFEGNVEDIVYTTVKSDATRMAALAAGDLDFVLDPPLQDIERLQRDTRLRIYREPENLVFFLGMDQARDELLYSDVKGRNPFKDLRVRRALYHAIDAEAINRVVMRGLAVSTGLMLPNPEAAGVPAELNRRLAYDVGAAKKLLAEAGYANGFATELDCQNVREAVCTAVAGMLARIGVRVKVNSLQNARYFAKGQARDTSFYLLGWGGQNTDAIFTLQPLLHSWNRKGDGDYNWGNYADPKMDALIDQARVEMDRPRRQALINEALAIQRDNIYHIPLHRRMAPWASRANVEVVHRPDSWLEVAWVRVR